MTENIEETLPSETLRAEGVWKVFGPRADRAVELSEGGATRAEVLTETGNTIGVRDVSFQAETGKTFVIMGLSGSGKSTLLRCVARLVEVTRGEVFLEGTNLTAMSEAELRVVRREKLSMVFQHFGLFPHRRVIDNVAYGLEVQGIDRKTRHRRAGEVLEMVGLSGWGSHYPQQLSGGMQQRVGLARALVVEPTVLFFDEPFSALDPLIRREMQDELLRLQAEMNRTIVFVTHDFDEAIKLGDRIAIMKDGVFDQVGTAAEIIASPATEYVHEFTKDVSRAKVLTAANVVTTVSGSAPERSVTADASIADLLPLLIESIEDIGVVGPDGTPLGRVDRTEVMRLVGPNP